MKSKYEKYPMKDGNLEWVDFWSIHEWLLNRSIIHVVRNWIKVHYGRNRK